jgi:CheY-like chemotaxis protein
MAAILIVEDDAFIRDDAEMMIQDWGHNTLLASDVDEALSLLRSSQQIDALFTDIYLKRAVLGGYELAHQAIKLRLNLRVLYTTGNTINDKMKAFLLTVRTSVRSCTRDFSSKTPLKCCSQRGFESV